MGTSTAGLLWKGLSKDYGGSFREKTVSACSHSERLLIAVNGLSQVFRQEHRRGIMIRISSHKEEDGLQVVISKTFRKSASDAKRSIRL